MNLQESIRRILKEIEEDRVQIRLGRSTERHFGTVQNIIIKVDDEDITGQDGEPGLGKMNIVIKDGEIIVGDIFIPEKFRRQGIATQVYQKISDHFGLPIVNSKTKGFNQTIEGGYIWKDREKFEPRNLQESIRRILREEMNKEVRWLLRRLKDPDVMGDLDETVKSRTSFMDACDMTEDEFFYETIENSTHNFINHWEELYETDDFLPIYQFVHRLIYEKYKDYIIEKYQSKMMWCD